VNRRTSSSKSLSESATTTPAACASSRVTV
jgi:hypothetical protein